MYIMFCGMISGRGVGQCSDFASQYSGIFFYAPSKAIRKKDLTSETSGNIIQCFGMEFPCNCLTAEING